MPSKGKDGYYHSKVVPAPGVKPVYFRARTLREFNQKREEIIETYRTGRSARSITFADLATEWLNTVKLPSVKPSTAANLRLFFKNHILPAFPPQQLARAVRYKDLQSCVDRLAGYSSGYVNQAIGMLKAICRYGLSEEALDADYSTALRLPLVTKSAGRSALTADQAAALRASWRPDPVHLALAFQYFCGLRCGESLAVQWGDVNFTSGRLHVVRQFNKTTSAITDLKTDNSDRFIDMPPELMRLLDPLRGLPHIYVCTGSAQPFTYGAFTYHFIKLMVALGFALPNEAAARAEKKTLAQGKRWVMYYHPNYYSVDFTPHNLRHNYATALYRVGIDPAMAMTYLGHSSYNTTMNVYTDIKNMLSTDVTLDDYLPTALEKVAKKLQTRRFSPSKNAENL